MCENACVVFDSVDGHNKTKFTSFSYLTTTLRLAVSS